MAEWKTSSAAQRAFAGRLLAGILCACAIGMVLTAHKTVTMFMRYVHTVDNPVRAAADAAALRRQTLIRDVVAVTDPEPESAHETILVPIAPEAAGR